MGNSEIIQNLFKELLIDIKNHIDKNKKEGKLPHDKIPMFKWKAKNFRYTKKGVETDGAELEHFDELNYAGAEIEIEKLFENSEKFIHLKQAVKDTFSKDFEYELRTYLTRCIFALLQDTISVKDIENWSTDIAKGLKGDAVTLGAEIKLLGIIIESKLIDFGDGIIMRQTKQSDIEEEFPHYVIGYKEHDWEHPSTIVELEMKAKQPIQLQDRIRNFIAALLLFRVGSIRYISYRIHGNTPNPWVGGTFSTLDKMRLRAINCLIHEHENSKLIKFWETMEKYIIESSLHGSNMTYQKIAFQRYTDSIKSPTIERRIADSMMGLECIFLYDMNDQQELSYRLRLRISKLLNFLGYDPHETLRILSTAYRIRSNFVHGGTLNYKEKNNLEEKYGTLENFALKVLDILRVSIVTSITLSVSVEHLLNDIDKSFLDNSYEEKLSQYLSNTKAILGAM